MTRTLARTTMPRRSWFSLTRHDVRSTLPASLQAIMQNGLLERMFEDALFPDLVFPALADNEPWAGGLGDTSIMTRTGLITPNPTPITGSDASTGTYSVEQWTVTMDQYGLAVDTNMLQSSMTLANKYIRDVQTLGLHAGQTLNRVARNKLFAGYAGGRTWCTTGATTDTSIIVADATGFTKVLVNGVPTPVSGTNPLTVTIAGVANTVTAVNVGTNTLTLGTTRVDVVGDYVLAANAPVSFRAGTARNSEYDMASTDVATLALYRQAVTRLRKMNVPTVNGNYIAHVTPDTISQLFADADWKQAYQGRGDSDVYKNLSIGTFGGLDWVQQNELPTVLGGSAGNVNVARTLVLGDGALVGAPFAEMGALLTGTGVEDVPAVRMIGPASGVQVALIVRPPQDRLQQNVSTSWSWVGDFGVPSDSTTGDAALFKRACMVEHAFV